MGENKRGNSARSTRRGVLAVASALTLDMAAAFFTRPALAEPAEERPKPGDLFVPADVAGAAPLTQADIAAGNRPIVASPMDPAGNVVRNGSRLNKLLILRLDTSTLTAPTRERAADGLLAYSAICPHAGCEVSGWNEQQMISNARVTRPITIHATLAQ